MKTYQYTSPEDTVVAVFDEDGVSRMSMLAEAVPEGANILPAEPTPEPSQFKRDQSRYEKRAAVKDSLIAFMAADNMSRVRSAAWSVADLTGLMADPAVAAANAYMSTLSFELAAQSILAATSPLLTPEIKAVWVGKLQEHFYLEP